MPATPEQIAGTFGALAARLGYRRASVDEVASTLRISKQTIYEQFGSKEGLYRAAVELWAREQRAQVEARLTETSALGRVNEVIAMAFADARRSLEDDRFGDGSEPPEILAEVNARVFGPMVRDLIVHGNESGEFQVTDPDTTAAFAVAVGMEAVRMMAEDRSGAPERAAHDAIRRLLVGAQT